VVSEGARQAGGREGVWVWGPTLSADLRVVPGVLPGVGKSPLHSEASVGALGVSSNGWVCHPLFVMILTRTEIECTRCIWSQGVDQDLPDYSPKMSIEQSRTFKRFLVCSWRGGGIGSSMGGSENEQAGGAGKAAEAWEEAQETLGAFRAWEVVTEGPAKEGPARGPWEVSSAAAELRLPLPAPLVGVTGLGGKGWRTTHNL
jgi:hypothetical protein